MKGRWGDFDDVSQGEFTVIERSSHKKATLTAHSLWDKGMEARRKMVDWIASYGNTLKYSTLKPLVDSDAPVSATEFDIELEIPPGGSEVKELAKLLLKVK